MEEINWEKRPIREKTDSRPYVRAKFMPVITEMKKSGFFDDVKNPNDVFKKYERILRGDTVVNGAWAYNDSCPETIEDFDTKYPCKSSYGFLIDMGVKPGVVIQAANLINKHIKY